MTMRTMGTALALAWLAGCSAAPSDPTTSDTTSTTPAADRLGSGFSGLLGINVNGAIDPAVVRSGLGATAVRMTLHLDAPPPSDVGGAALYDVAGSGYALPDAWRAAVAAPFQGALGARIRAFHAQGIDVLLTVDYEAVPDWRAFTYDPKACSPVCDLYGEQWRGFANFFAAVAGEAARDWQAIGSTDGDAIEIWNEADSKGMAPVNSLLFGELLARTTAELETVYPNHDINRHAIVAGATSALYYADLVRDGWLDAIRSLDAYNLHPYGFWPGDALPSDPKYDFTTFVGQERVDGPYFHATLASELDALYAAVEPDGGFSMHKPVWLTEWGSQIGTADDGLVFSNVARDEGHYDYLRAMFDFVERSPSPHAIDVLRAFHFCMSEEQNPDPRFALTDSPHGAHWFRAANAFQEAAGVAVTPPP